MSILANQIVETLRQVWHPHTDQFIPLHAPKFDGNEKKCFLMKISSAKLIEILYAVYILDVKEILNLL